MSRRTPWLAARRNGIGGSDAAAILGLSPWKSPMSVWLDKKGLLEEPVDPEREFLMQLGKDLEPVIAKLYERRTGKELWQPTEPGIFVHTQYPCLIGTPDRLVKNESRGVELKTENPYQDNFGEPGTDQVPEHYLIQCVHYMAITAYPEWDIALLRGAHFDIYTIKRDLGLENEITGRLVAWWQKHIVGNMPPDIDGSDTWRLHLERRYPRNILPAIKADEATCQLARKLQAGLRMKEVWEAATEELKNRLKGVIGDCDGLLGDFGKITWRKSKDITSVDWERLARENILAAHLAIFLPDYTTVRPGARRFVFTPNKKEQYAGTEIGNSGSEAGRLIADGEEAAAVARD